MDFSVIRDSDVCNCAICNV